MFTVLYFLLFILSIVSLSPLLAYPVFLFLQPIINLEFHKLISNVTLITGLLFCIFYVKQNNINLKEGFGYTLPAGSFFRQMILSSVAGILIMAILIANLLILGIHQTETDLELSFYNITKIIVVAIVSGFAVALIEESIFRGALFSVLHKKINALTAIILTSFVYASAHFIKYRALPSDAEIHWYTGLEMLPKALFRFSDPVIIDSFLTLFILGVLLALIRLRNGNIAQSVGVHAGIVIVIKISGDLTDVVPGASYIYLVNDYNHLLGYLACFWLILACIIYYQFFMRKIPDS